MVEAVGWDHSVEEEKGRRVMESLREVFADGAMQVWPQSWVIQYQNMPQVEIMPIADIFKTFFSRCDSNSNMYLCDSESVKPSKESPQRKILDCLGIFPNTGGEGLLN